MRHNGMAGGSVPIESGATHRIFASWRERLLDWLIRQAKTAELNLETT
jgi:hypothetical protein